MNNAMRSILLLSAAILPSLAQAMAPPQAVPMRKAVPRELVEERIQLFEKGSVQDPEAQILPGKRWSCDEILLSQPGDLGSAYRNLDQGKRPPLRSFVLDLKSRDPLVLAARNNHGEFRFTNHELQYVRGEAKTAIRFTDSGDIVAQDTFRGVLQQIVFCPKQLVAEP